MIQMSDAFVLIQTLVFVAFTATLWRMMNSRGSVSWNSQTTESETSQLRRDLELTIEELNRVRAETVPLAPQAGGQ